VFRCFCALNKPASTVFFRKKLLQTFPVSRCFRVAGCNAIIKPPNHPYSFGHFLGNRLFFGVAVPFHKTKRHKNINNLLTMQGASYAKAIMRFMRLQSYVNFKRTFCKIYIHEMKCIKSHSSFICLMFLKQSSPH